MDPLRHDPRTKQQIKDALYHQLYDPVQKKFRERLDSLITRNSMAQGLTHRSFQYKGVLYTCESAAPPIRPNRLSPHLVPEMQAYLKDVTELNEKEMPYVLGFINQVLNSSNNIGDYLTLLPESVHHPVKVLQATCPCRNPQLLPDMAADLFGQE